MDPCLDFFHQLISAKKFKSFDRSVLISFYKARKSSYDGSEFDIQGMRFCSLRYIIQNWITSGFGFDSFD